MKCKINGFWNSSGTGTNDNNQPFSWNNFFFSTSYTDKKQSNMIGEKSKTFKVRASDLNQLLGLGLTPDGVQNLVASDLNAYNMLGSVCLIEFDDDSNLIDFEILTEGKPLTAQKDK